MSYRVTASVWEHSKAQGVDRYVLLAIAWYADDSGHEAWPSVPTLAERTGLARRTVQRSIQALVDAGDLRVERNAGGNSKAARDKRPNRYTVVVRGVTKSPRGASQSPKRGDSQSKTGRQRVTRTVIEPSRNAEPMPLGESMQQLERVRGRLS